MDIEFRVAEKPPVKQSAEDSGGTKLELSRNALTAEAKKHFPEPVKGEVIIQIYHVRSQGSDTAVNIIGGIADSLKGIAFVNDRQLVDVYYTEKNGSTDGYQVRIISLNLVRSTE